MDAANGSVEPNVCLYRMDGPSREVLMQWPELEYLEGGIQVVRLWRSSCGVTLSVQVVRPGGSGPF